MSDVRTEYTRRLDERRQALASWSATDERISWLRLATFAVGVVVAPAAWRGAISWWWLAGPLGAFLALVRWHDRVIERRVEAATVVTFYERGLARLDDTWAGHGASGAGLLDPEHLYAADLDLFGRGSLFELLCLARTAAGEATLGGWLAHPAVPTLVRARQTAVAELAGRLDLRERLWSIGGDVAAAVRSDTLTAWAASPPSLPGWLQPASALLTLGVVGTGVLASTTGNYTPLLVALALEGAILARHLATVSAVLHAAGSWSRELDVLGRLLAVLEREQFSAPLLAERSAQLVGTHRTPSQSIRSLHRLCEMHDWQHNVIFATVAAPLLWGVHLALAVERWRGRHGQAVKVWLDAVAEIEALASLAAYQHEHPEDVWPTLVEDDDARVEGVGLGHPLLPSAQMVRNDVALGGDRRLLVVSGSNMSGKSTMLRTVGVNVVLAFAGAPVRARSFVVSPLRIGATLRIQDSLQEGRSRFFAEITRVKRIADQSTQKPPTLFLLDELFHGTNSHDRLAGAAGVLRALLGRGAIGLVTTHDLALVSIASELPHAANVHFEDRFEGGTMTFDYTMKAGPVTSSNAVALMRAVGLEVD